MSRDSPTTTTAARLAEQPADPCAPRPRWGGPRPLRRSRRRGGAPAGRAHALLDLAAHPTALRRLPRPRGASWTWRLSGAPGRPSARHPDDSGDRPRARASPSPGRRDATRPLDELERGGRPRGGRRRDRASSSGSRSSQAARPRRRRRSSTARRSICPRGESPARHRARLRLAGMVGPRLGRARPRRPSAVPARPLVKSEVEEALEAGAEDSESAPPGELAPSMLRARLREHL